MKRSKFTWRDVLFVALLLTCALCAIVYEVAKLAFFLRYAGIYLLWVVGAVCVVIALVAVFIGYQLRQRR